LNVDAAPGIVVPHLESGFPQLIRASHVKHIDDHSPVAECLKAMEMIIHATETKEKDFRYIKGWIEVCLTKVKEGEGRDFLLALLEDIEHDDPNKGQLMKAVSTAAWFNSWGKNHLLSYRRALIRQVCMNFKDAALQLFRGTLFKEIQEMGTKLFIDLPAPQPTGYSAYGGAPSVSTINMSNFMAANGGCFSGESLVELHGGIIKPAEKCVKGDVLSNGSVIRCVVRTKLNNHVKMVQLSENLTITPWHPVVAPSAMQGDPNAWQFPCYLTGEVTYVFHDAFYDFVVEGKDQWAAIDGYKVAMLGHGMAYNDVIRHPYYGTQEVIRVLESKEGWVDGLVDL
jgi:hypothetical protein